MGTLHLSNLLPDLSFILKRLWRQREFVACVALSLIVATALAVTIPLYADAANYNMLNTAQAKSSARSSPSSTYLWIAELSQAIGALRALIRIDLHVKTCDRYI